MADENQAQPNPAENTPTPQANELLAETTQPEAQPQETPEAPAPEAQPQEQKPAQRGKPFQQRIDQLTREKHDKEREIQRLRAELEARQQPQQNASEGAQPQPQPQQFQPAPHLQQFNDELVNRRAAQLVEQRMLQDRMNQTLQAGNKDFQDFTDRCNTLASLGASERPDFLSVVTDPSIIPDGHKVLANLADDPNEAARILSLPPVQMSAALVRYAENLNKPKPAAVSKAPTPLKPITATAKPSEEPSADDDDDSWFAKREAQIAKRKSARG